MKTKSNPIPETLVLHLSRHLTLCLIFLIAWGIQQGYAQTNGLWTWVDGSTGTNVAGVYGTKGIPAPSNMPGARYAPSAGASSASNFWFFGGINGSGGYFNDLWTYDPATNYWTWISGNNTFNAAGVYGTRGVAATANTPGARYGQAGWTDKSGNIWIFGGLGYDGSGTVGYLNDLWMFNVTTSRWTWVSGSNTANQYGVYGTLGTGAVGNIPGSRSYPSSWVDASGNFWIFGGLGYSAANSGYLDDLWEYNPSTQVWTWMNGFNSAGHASSYGTQNVAAATNLPSGRYAQGAVADASGNFWMFGGHDQAGLKNDLWKYQPATGQWTWVSGGTSTNSSGVYGSQGVAAASNVPGSRVVTNILADQLGNIWLFGGGGYGSSSSGGVLNDLWAYVPSSGKWTWVDGSNAINPAGSYGTMGIATLSNQPPGRQVNAAWVDAAGNFWVMGGFGTGTFNDLWEYNPIAVLSLKALTLEGTTKGSQKILTWQTTGEVNTTSFAVERSTDGTSFSDIGAITATGTGDNSYSFIDADLPPQATTLIYRIKAGDQAGSASYSNIVKFSVVTTGATFVFPNPAASGVTLQLGDATLLNTPASLVDIGGRVVGRQMITTQQQYIDLHQLVAGIYFLQLTNGTTLKIIKHIGL